MSSVRSVDRAVDILLAFSREQPSMEASELQKKVGLARPTLYRMLGTLESKGLVRSVGDPRRYELGYKIMQLANIWLSQLEVNRIAQPVLDKLRRSSDETIALNVPFSDQARLCAIELQSRLALAFSVGVGHVEPMHIGASGKVILAFWPPHRQEAALRDIAPRARTDLFAQLEQIRKAGFALTHGEVMTGAVAISAPVFDRTGEVVASVSIVGPEVRLNEAMCQKSARLAKAAASEISLGLGYVERPLIRARSDGRPASRPTRQSRNRSASADA